MMRLYYGNPADRSVWVTDAGGNRYLLPSATVREQGVGFAWGAISPAAAHLAYALLLDVYGVSRADWIDEVFAPFAQRVLLRLPVDREWVLSEQEIERLAAKSQSGVVAA